MARQRRPRLAIVGLGLIGGSLGLALKSAGSDYEIIGHNRHYEAAGQAMKAGAVDRAEWNLPRAVDEADVVVVAVAPRAIETVFRDIAPYLRPGTIVTDVGSTKVDVLAWAESILPSHADFVGGHPMAGKELSGIAAADAALFRGATYCIVSGTRSTARGIDTVAAIARAVGARPYFLEAAEHDSYVAAVSHVPFIAAASLVGAVSAAPGWTDMARLAAGGFRDSTRTASADVDMHTDICLTNREAIVQRLDQLLATLADVRQSVTAGDEDAIRQFFLSAKETRDQWLANRVIPPGAAAVLPMPERPGLSELLFGGLGRNRRDRDASQ
ncbi:MAG: prephenate dehydrogenase/arogenate dehydrogenase family protein [Chloroflexota bacterium]|nr:MAG: prephenate dehydrogenase/arogenate dehydrogenase family protein [Chloroflexota bacterium]